MDKQAEELTLLGLKLKLSKKEGVCFIQINEKLHIPMYQLTDLLMYDSDIRTLPLSVNKVAEDFVSDVISDIEDVC